MLIFINKDQAQIMTIPLLLYETWMPLYLVKYFNCQSCVDLINYCDFHDEGEFGHTS